MRPLLFRLAGSSTKAVVPEVGLEPTRPEGQRILNPPRMPIPPLRLMLLDVSDYCRVVMVVVSSPFVTFSCNRLRTVIPR